VHKQNEERFSNGFCLSTGVLVLLSLSGCLESQLEHDPLRIHPQGGHLSRSIVLSDSNRSSQGLAFTYEILLDKRASEPERLTLISKSCGCASVALEDRRLRIGDTLTVVPGKSVIVSVNITPSSQANTKTVSVAFSRHSEKTLSLTATLEVFAAASLTPNVLFLEVDSDSGDFLSLNTILTLTWEGMKENAFSFELNDPETRIVAAKPLGSPTEIRTGLWRQKWSLDFEIPVSINFSRQLILKSKNVNGSLTDSTMLVRLIESQHDASEISSVDGLFGDK